MIKKKGYRNVKTVQGGGKAMERYFDHFQGTYYGGKIVKPITGKVIKIGKP